MYRFAAADSGGTVHQLQRLPTQSMGVDQRSANIFYGSPEI